MDNLTHSLVGLTAAKAGLEKLSPRTTTLCILAANAADFDIVTLFFGDRWSFLKYHRGITHSVVGTIGLALIIPILFYVVEFTLARLRSRPLEINIAGLFVASAIVSATHPLLDWSNNYGIRLLLPWNPRWFYGDFVFIIDPFLWVLFGGASFLLASKTRAQVIVWSVLGLLTTLFVLLGPIQRTSLSHPLLVRVLWIAALMFILFLFAIKAEKRWGHNIAIASFLIFLGYWGSLAYAHSLALKKARTEAAMMVQTRGEAISRLVAMPTLANPLGWECVFETERATYRFETSLISNSAVSDIVRYDKPSPETWPLIQKASEDRRVKVLLDFSRFPVVRLADTDCTTQTLVQFADLRYTEPGQSRGTFALEVSVECPDQRLNGSK